MNIHVYKNKQLQVVYMHRYIDKQLHIVYKNRYIDKQLQVVYIKIHRYTFTSCIYRYT